MKLRRRSPKPATASRPFDDMSTPSALPKQRIVVAMSGGVDSSVAALLLHDQGYEVVGVTLHLWDYPDDSSIKSRCCAPEDIHDARRVCDTLGVPHYAFDRRQLFYSEVVQPFVDDYVKGVTPSPCVRCNRGVKVKELVAIAKRLGAVRIATGHYARTHVVDGKSQLLRATDNDKDQSYFLHMLDSATLEQFVFPLGEMSKDQVRALALARALPGATKGESQELCFVPTGRYDAFVEERADKAALRPGPIVDENGEVVANHTGIHRYTIGQRRNLGVAVGKRAYVVALDAHSGQVTLGDKEQLHCSGAELDEFSLSDGMSLPLSCQARVRYRGTLHAARVQRLGEAVSVTFDSPVQAVVPGQFIVLYHDDQVVGGGRIVRPLLKQRVHLPLVGT
jgi:tRNA-specific 2-thiouridylase